MMEVCNGREIVLHSAEFSRAVELVEKTFTRPRESVFDFIVGRGGVVFPATPEGKPLARLDSMSHRIEDRQVLQSWYIKGVRRFIFRPASAGLIVFDLDRKNEKDGLGEFQQITGINPVGLPHCRTPHNGLHLYFFSDAEYLSTQANGIDVKHTALCTLPGSVSGAGKYDWFGAVADIKRLPSSVRKILRVKPEEHNEKLTPRQNMRGLNEIYRALQNQGIFPTYGNRNRFVFEFSRYARKQGHAPDEVFNFLRTLKTQALPLREINATIRSAYRGAR